MNLLYHKLVRVAPAFGAALALLWTLGCGFVPAKKPAADARKSADGPAPMSDFDPGVADFCQETMPRDPGESFHFRAVQATAGGNDGRSMEGDVSPERIDLTSRVGASTTTNHYQRSDKNGWSTALTLMAMSTPWMQRNMAKFDMEKVGPETLGEFDTFRYAVDTTNDQNNKASFLRTTGLKNYNIVGTLWLTRDTGCIAKYVIDDTDYGRNGEVTTTRYEGAVGKIAK